MSIAIFSFEEDLHAIAVQHELSRRGIETHIVETSLFAPQRGVTWSSTECEYRSELLSRNGRRLQASDFRLVWWRKLGQTLRRPTGINATEVEFLMNNWRHAYEGLMFTEFEGLWISHPLAQRQAEIKIRQLEAASSIGFTVPDTLVSSDPVAVREFCGRHGGRIIAKSLRGATTYALATIQLSLADLEDDEAIRACPTIYQEVIGGAIHLRAHVFGTDVLTTSIHSENLDWRRDLNVPFRKFTSDSTLDEKLVKLVEKLDLRMGIMDLKLSPSGAAIWLEINPQGQFLFAEALSGSPLLEHFANFLEFEYSYGCNRS